MLVRATVACLIVFVLCGGGTPQAARGAQPPPAAGMAASDWMLPHIAQLNDKDLAVRLKAATSLVRGVSSLEGEADSQRRAGVKRAAAIVIDDALAGTERQFYEKRDMATRAASLAPETLAARAKDAPAEKREWVVSLGRGSHGVPLLRQLLGDPDPGVRDLAAIELTRSGRAGIAAMFEALGDKNADVRAAAASRLIGLELYERATDAQVRELISIGTRLVADPDPRVRSSGGEMLGKSGLGDVVVPHLLRLAADPDPGVRSFVSSNLSRFAAGSPAALDAHLKLMSDPDAKVRSYAVNWIGERWLDTGTEEQIAKIVAALTKALDDAEEGVRMEAASKLGRFGAEAAAAKPKIEALIGKAKPEQARMLQHILKKIDDSSANPAFALVLEEANERLASPEAEVRMLGVRKLTEARLPRRTIVPIARKLLDDPDDQVAAAAVHLLMPPRYGGPPGPRDIDRPPPELLDKLKSDEPSQRKAGVDALAAYAGTEPVYLLSQRLTEDDDATVRAAARAALKKRLLASPAATRGMTAAPATQPVP
jgi:HEAT repeat protein